MAIPFLSGNEITDSVRRIGLSGDGLAPEQGSVGLWEATTNLAPNGGFEASASGWTGLAAGSTLSRSTVRSKFGSASLKVVCDGTNVDQGCFLTPYATISPATVYTLSSWVYVESGSSDLRLVVDEFLADVYVDTPIYNSFTALRGGWIRVSGVWTSNAGAGQAGPSIRNTSAVATTFYVDGVQIEQQPIATPYVDTNGSPASRSASRAFVSTPSAFLNTTQGWVATRVRMGWDATPDAGGAFIFSWGDDNNNRLIFYFADATNLWGTRNLAAAGGYVNLAVPAAQVGLQRTLIFAWTATTVKISAGDAFTSAGNSSIPTLATTTMDIGSFAWIGTPYYLDSDFNWFAMGSGTLTDADAIRIASFNNDPVIGSFPGSPTFFWNPNNAPGVTSAIPHTSSGVAW